MAVHEKPDDDLRIDAAFLAVSDLAELVFVLDLEMQGRHVIHHQCHVSVSGGLAVTSRSQLASVTPPCDPGQTAVHPRPVHRNNPELGQNPRALSSIDVGSTRRASTSWKNASSPTTSKPNAFQAARTTSTSKAELLPVTTAGCVGVAALKSSIC